MVKFNVSARPPSLNFTWNDNQINLQDITTAVSTAIYKQTFNCVSDTDQEGNINIRACNGNLNINGKIINAGVQSAKNQCIFKVANLTQMKNSIANEIAASLSNKESALGSILSDATNEITQNIITTVDQAVNQQLVANIINKAVMEHNIILGATPQCYTVQYNNQSYIPINQPTPGIIGDTKNPLNPSNGPQNISSASIQSIYGSTSSSILSSLNDIPQDTSISGLIPISDPNFINAANQCNDPGDPCTALQNFYDGLKTFTNSSIVNTKVSACSDCNPRFSENVNITGNIENYSIQTTLNQVCLKDTNVSQMASNIATSVNDALSNKITMGFFEIILIIVVLVVVGVIIFRALKKGKSNTYVEGQTPGNTVSLSPS